MFCHISKDDLKKPLSDRGESKKRTLQTLDEDLERFQTEFDGDIKKAKFANNVIGHRIFNIPIDQVGKYWLIRLGFNNKDKITLYLKKKVLCYNNKKSCLGCITSTAHFIGNIP